MDSGNSETVTRATRGTSTASGIRLSTKRPHVVLCTFLINFRATIHSVKEYIEHRVSYVSYHFYSICTSKITIDYLPLFPDNIPPLRIGKPMTISSNISLHKNRKIISRTMNSIAVSIGRKRNEHMHEQIAKLRKKNYYSSHKAFAKAVTHFDLR